MRAENSKTRSHKSKVRILVVDDQPEVLGTIQDVLEYGGFEVGTAENGMQALNLLMSGHYFDLVITDIKMPEMDGLELLKQIRKLRKDLPVIVMTGNATLRDGLRAMGQWAFDHISKPFDIKVLMKVIRKAVKENR